MKTIQTPAPVEPRERPAPALPARRPVEEEGGALAEFLPPLVGALIGVVVLIGVGVVMAGQAGGLAALGTALLGAHSAWYLSRASAFVSYILMWWSMVLGLSITNRLARVWPGGPTANDLHEHASLLGLVFGALHGLVLLGDQYIGYNLTQILIPFASVSYLPLWVGLGQVAMYLMIVVTFSFYVRRWIGARTWRVLHYLSFLLFALALAHGVLSGTDSSTPWVVGMYLGSAVSVLGMTIYRIFVRSAPAKSQPAAA
jgi:predicted ferric reductase